MRLMFGHDVLPTRISPSASARTGEGHPRVHAEVEDWAIRAAARNGFGGEPVQQFNSVELHHAARRPAHVGLSRLMARGLRRVAALMRVLRRRLRHASQLSQLQALDAAALRDLGLDRSELGSVHAEISGLSSPTRRIVVEHEWRRLRAGVSADHWATR
jgi:uncharacterized protein YjiS (DUF1127 family)